MAEAKEQLADACPEGFKVKYFFYVEIIGTEKASVSVDFESIVEHIGEGEEEEDVKQGRLVFMQFVDGKWIWPIQEPGSGSRAAVADRRWA